MTKITVFTLLFSGFAFGNANAQAHIKGEFTLPSLIIKAIDYHPSIKSNLFLEDSAKEDITTAKWQYFPTPSFSVSQVSASSADVNYSGDKRVATLGLTQPLWSGGAIDAGLAKSRAQFALARATTRVSQQQLATRVINSYSQWYGSYLTKESYKKSQKEHEALRIRLQRRVKQGLSSSSDLNLANSRLQQASANFNSSVIQHENSLLRLEELLGFPLNVQDLVSDFSIIKFQDNQSNLRRRALLNSPLIKQVKAESLVTEAEIKQSKANLYPTVNLKVEKQWGNFTTKDSENESRIFLEFNSSFGAGLSNLSKTRKIENRHQSLKARIEDEEKQAIQQVKLDWMNSISLEKQKSLFESSIANTEQVRKSYYRQFLAGRKTWREVMSSIREVSELESKLAGVYKEMIATNWRIFVYVEGIDTIVASSSNKGLTLSRTDKVLWYPGIKPKKEENIFDKVLNTIIPNEQPVEKIIWYFDNAKNFKLPSKKKESFLDFISLFDDVPVTDAAPIMTTPKQSTAEIVQIPPTQALKPTSASKKAK